MERFKERVGVVEVQSKIIRIHVILVLDTFIDGTVKFVHGHTEAFIEITR